MRSLAKTVLLGANRLDACWRFAYLWLFAVIDALDEPGCFSVRMQTNTQIRSVLLADTPAGLANV